MPRDNKHIVDIELQGKNKTRRAFGDAEKGFKRMSGSFIAGAAAITAGLGYSIKKAADFERRMANLATVMSGDTAPQVDQLRKGILAMTRVLPRSADEIGAAAYTVLSGSIEGTAKQLEVLRAGTELGIAGLGTTEEATKLLVGALNAFQLQGEDTEKVADMIFKTIRSGITTASELTQSFGTVAASMQTAGVPLAEYLAATASLTTSTTTASVAQNQLRAAINKLTTSSPDMDRALAGIGFQTGRAAIETHGFKGTLDLLFNSVGNNVDEMKKLFSGAEEWAAVAPLVGSASGHFAQTLEYLLSETSALKPAVEEVSDTMASDMQLAMNAVDEASILLGGTMTQILAPALKDVTKDVSDGTAALSEMGIELDDVGVALKDYTIKLPQTFSRLTSYFGTLIGDITGIRQASFDLQNQLTGLQASGLSAGEALEVMFKDIADSLVNNLISRVNQLIDLVNRLPGINIPKLPDSNIAGRKGPGVPIGTGSRGGILMRYADGSVEEVFQTPKNTPVKTPRNTPVKTPTRTTTRTTTRKTGTIGGGMPFAGAPRWARLAEGGIVTKPTTALVGEAGPEAVVPLDRKSGMVGGITINISGNFVGSEEEAIRLGNIITDRAKLNKRFSF